MEGLLLLYDRIWDIRGTTTLGSSIGYIISVILIGLSGLLFAILTLVACCGSCCYRCCAASERCPCKRRKLIHPPLASLRERFASVVLVLVLLVFTAVGMMVAAFGLYVALRSIEPLVRLADLFIRTAASFLFAINEILRLSLALLELVPDGVVPSLNNTDVAVAQVLNWTVSTRNTLCAVQGGVFGGYSALVVIMILSVNSPLAALPLFGLAAIRKQPALFVIGAVLLVVSMVVSSIAFAFATPVSVFVDDFCFTIELVVNANRTNTTAVYNVIMTCLEGDAFSTATDVLVNFTDVLCNTRINSDTASFNAYLGWNVFTPLPFTVSFLRDGTTRQIAYSAANFSIPPVRNFMQEGFDRILSNKTVTNLEGLAIWRVVVIEAALLPLLQACFVFLGLVSRCLSGIWSEWITTSRDLVCEGLRGYIPYAVWGTFAASICLIACAICYFSFRQMLVEKRKSSALRETFVALLLLGLALGFSMGITGMILAYDQLFERAVTDDVLSFNALSICNMCVNAVLFVAIAVPALYWNVRARFFVLFVALLAVASFFAFNVAFAVTSLLRVDACFQGMCGLFRSCSLARTMTLLGRGVISIIASIGNLIALITACCMLLVPRFRELDYRVAEDEIDKEEQWERTLIPLKKRT